MQEDESIKQYPLLMKKSLENILKNPKLKRKLISSFGIALI